jgi:hypothetical protein
VYDGCTGGAADCCGRGVQVAGVERCVVCTKGAACCCEEGVQVAGVERCIMCVQEGCWLL